MKSFLYTLCVTIFLSACSGNKGGGSDVIIPESPSNLTGIAVSPTQVNLSWTDGSSNEDGFKIERKSGSGDFAEIGTVGVSVTSFSNVGLTPNQAYTYRVIAYNAAGKSRNYSNTVTVTPNNLPVISTKPASEISFNYVLSGGNLFGDGGSPITAKGICWNQTGNPTIALPTKTVDGNGAGSFTSFVSGLTPGIQYFARAYATNANGTSYGEQVQFTAETIESVVICGKEWMTKNLKVTRYKNGDPIVALGADLGWGNSSYTTGSYCYPYNEPAIGDIYGKLYNWFAASDPRGIAPDGWHVATEAELNSIKDCPGINGNSLRMTGTTYWAAPNSDATNSTGFSAVGSGMRFSNGNFTGRLEFAYFWPSTPGPGGVIPYHMVLYNQGGNITIVNSRVPQCLMAIRCVKD